MPALTDLPLLTAYRTMKGHGKIGRRLYGFVHGEGLVSFAPDIHRAKGFELVVPLCRKKT